MKDLLAQIKDEDGKETNKYEGIQRVYLYMKIFYGFFFIWVGYNILMDDKIFERNKKYLNESLIFLKKILDYYFPNLLSNETLIKFFDYNNLLNRTYEIILLLSVLFIFGGFLISVGYKLGKIIIIIDLILNILFVYNLFYMKGESLKVTVFKYWSLLGGATYL